jgi:hypothetical protein
MRTSSLGHQLHDRADIRERDGSTFRASVLILDWYRVYSIGVANTRVKGGDYADTMTRNAGNKMSVWVIAGSK